MNNLTHYQLSYDTNNQGNKTFPYLLSYQYKVVSWLDELVDNVGSAVKIN